MEKWSDWLYLSSCIIDQKLEIELLKQYWPHWQGPKSCNLYLPNEYSNTQNGPPEGMESSGQLSLSSSLIEHKLIVEFHNA